MPSTQGRTTPMVCLEYLLVLLATRFVFKFMKRCYKILLLGCLLIPTLAIAQKKESHKQKMVIADSLFDDGDYKGAITYYQSSAALYKNSSKDYYIHCQNKVADCQVRQGNL